MDIEVLQNNLIVSTDFVYYIGVQSKIFKENIIEPRYYIKCQVK